MSGNSDTAVSLLKNIKYNIVFRDVASILKKKLKDNKTVVDFESESFLNDGDNYGSTMMKITVRLKGNNQENVETLHLVAKLLPQTDFQRDLFDSAYTFHKEIFFYEQLMPVYNEIHKGEFNTVPEYYGSRLSLDPDADEVDDDAALLLENLKYKGYYMVDRFKGLDSEHLKVIIPVLAKFHAIGLSIKHKKPSFLQILKNHNRRIEMIDFQKILLSKLMRNIEENSEVNQFYNRIKALYDDSTDTDHDFTKILKVDDPWACVVHFDLWNNNMLFHLDDNDEIDDVKIFDFQTYAVSSPLTDLIFLLSTSMQHPTEQFDAMIELYRATACKVLKDLDSDVNLFVKEAFEERLKIDAISEIFHIILMINVVEFRERDEFLTKPVNEYVIRHWKRIFEIYELKKWL